MAVEQLVYAWLEKGRGVDPEMSGFQVAAVSPGLEDETRKVVAAISRHLKDTVYGNAGKEALEAEARWRAENPEDPEPPEEVRSGFPAAYSYLALDEKRFALTRAVYAGLCGDKARSGNVLSHTLVLEAGDLAPLAYRPLGLVGSGVFIDAPPDSPELPALATLKNHAASRPDYALLRKAPFAGQVATMVTALSGCVTDGPVVVLCLPSWRVAPGFVDALTSLLPPGARTAVTFTTLETDRSWRPEGLEHGREGEPPYRLVTHCARASEDFGLAPEHYRKHRVYNFVGNRHSTGLAESEFARLAARSLEEGRLEPVRRFHKLCLRLGMERRPEAWGALSRANVLLADAPAPGELAEAARAVARLPLGPEQARVLVELFYPHVRSLARGPESASLEPLGEPLSRIVVLARASSRGATDVGKGLEKEAVAALSGGRAKAAAALLDMLGDSRDSRVPDVVARAVSLTGGKFPMPEAVRDREALAVLVTDALAARSESVLKVAPALLVLAATAAGHSGRCGYFWDKLAEPLIKPMFKGDPSPDRRRLLDRIADSMDPADCPRGALWLHERILQIGTPGGERLATVLGGLAGGLARTGGADAGFDRLMDLAGKHFEGPLRFALCLGRMADRAAGAPLGDRIGSEYRRAVAGLAARDAMKVRRALARAGAGKVLAREIMGDVLPWTEPESDEKFARWKEEVLGEPGIVGACAGRVAAILRETDRPGEIEPLAARLLALAPDQEDPGIVDLFTTVVERLPLGPLSGAWVDTLTRIPSGAPEELVQRLRVARFLRMLADKAAEPGWSPADFPHEHEVWRDTVPDLEEEAREAVVKWCLDLCGAAGVVSGRDAAGVHAMLSAGRDLSAEKTAVRLLELLDGRDPVTRVVMAMAFARGFLEGGGEAELGAAVAGGLLTRYAPEERKLFERHLAGHFGRPMEDYKKRMTMLCAKLGIAVPGFAPRSTKARGAEPDGGDRGADEENGGVALSGAAAAPKGGLWDVLGRFRKT